MCPKKWTVSSNIPWTTHVRTSLQHTDTFDYAVKGEMERVPACSSRAKAYGLLDGISTTPQVLIKNAHQYEHIQSLTFRVIGPHLLATFPLPLFQISRARHFYFGYQQMTWSGQPSANATRNAKRTINTRETLHGHDMMLPYIRCTRTTPPWC